MKHFFSAVLYTGVVICGFFMIRSHQLFAVAETQTETLRQLTFHDPQSSDVRAQAIFAGFDNDENESLDEDEFAKVVIRYFALLDADHDGVLITAELPRGWTPELQSMDVNKDKKIQFVELTNAIFEGFKRRDLDNDGKLSYAEVKNQIEKNRSANS